jgi:hypothetical protein
MLDKITEAVNVIAEETAFRRQDYANITYWFSQLLNVSEEVLHDDYTCLGEIMERKFAWYIKECKNILKYYTKEA